MYKIGLSSCGYPLTEQNFAALQKANIEAVEISMHPDLYSAIDYRNVKELSDRYNLQIWSYHLPFYPFDRTDVASLDKAIRQKTINAYTEYIAKASDIGCKIFVVHPSGEPIEDDKREQHFLCAMETLDKLAEIAAKYGSFIAVEDLPRSCLGNTTEEMLRLIGVNDKLKVCFDTNHLLKGDPVEFVDKIGSKIITLHVSDYDFVDEKHWLPYEGDLNWPKLVDALKRANYNGVWMYELRTETPKTMDRKRILTFEDIYKNGKDILNGKIPEIIGTRK